LDLATLKENDIPFKKKIGIVFQDFKLPPDQNDKDNMLLVLKATVDHKSGYGQKIDEVLIKV
jgi:ABC-type ATPase involved in cell division